MTSQLPDDAITAEARTAFVNFWSAVGPWIAGAHADPEDVAHEAFHAGWQAALPELTGAITAQAEAGERERILSGDDNDPDPAGSVYRLGHRHGRADERERIRPLVTAWQAVATEQDSRRSTMAVAIHGARTGVYQACADALADLLGGAADGAHTPGGAT